MNYKRKKPRWQSASCWCRGKWFKKAPGISRKSRLKPKDRVKGDVA